MQSDEKIRMISLRELIGHGTIDAFYLDKTGYNSSRGRAIGIEVYLAWKHI